MSAAALVRPSVRRRRGARARRGFALPTALLLIVVFTVLAASSLAFVGSERRAAGTQIAQVGALAVARSGMERYLADVAARGPLAPAPAAYDSAREALADGYADVVLSRVRDGAATGTPSLYLLRSHGVKVDPASGRELAERTVARYARWQEARMSVLAAWTSYSGITKPDAFGTIDGADACGEHASVAGVAVPLAPGFVQTGGGASILRGSPPQLALDPLTPAGVSPADWGAITRVGAISGARDIWRQGWPSAAEWANASYWPTLVTDDGLVLPGDGRGLLIVAGNLTVSATRSWSGVILVGGAITVTGNFTVDGAIVSGLAATNGGSAAPSNAGPGSVAYRYNSCAVASALARYRGLAPFRNATIDDWPTY